MKQEYFLRERILETERNYIHAQCVLLSDIIQNFEEELHELVEKENRIDRELKTVRNKIEKVLENEN